MSKAGPGVEPACVEWAEPTAERRPHGEVVVVHFQQMLRLGFARLGHIGGLLGQGAAGRGRVGFQHQRGGKFCLIIYSKVVCKTPETELRRVRKAGMRLLSLHESISNS